jgi:hypothetical protein
MSLEEVINKIIEELKATNQLRAYDEIVQLDHCYACGTMIEKLSSLEGLTSWCHPKALGDLKVSNYSNEERLTLLANLSAKCNNERKQLERI